MAGLCCYLCRYGVELVCKKQPLLRGRGVSHCKNLLSPRFETSEGKLSFPTSFIVFVGSTSQGLCLKVAGYSLQCAVPLIFLDLIADSLHFSYYTVLAVFCSH